MKLRTFLRSSIIVLKYIILGKSYYSKKKEGKSSYLTQKERDEWFRKNIENKVPDKVKPAARLENVEKKPWLQDKKKDKIKTALVVQLITITVIISIVLGPMTFWETPTPVFAENLNFLFKFGDSGSGEDPSKFPDGALFKPSGIELFAGKIYITDENNHVQVFDSSGEFLFKFGQYGHGDGEFDYSAELAIDKSGKVYVADERNDRIQVFDSSGEFLFKFGRCTHEEMMRQYNLTDDFGNFTGEREQVCGHGKNIKKTGGVGHGDGELHEPSDVTVDKSGKIYVADRGHATVKVFDSSGKFLFNFGTGTECTSVTSIFKFLSFVPGSAKKQCDSKDGEFHYVNRILVDDYGKVYVSDTENNRIQVFDSSGKFLYKFGKYGHENGEFDEPYDMALDSSGRLYVVDIYNNRVQIFDTLGRFIDKFGYYCQTSNNLGLHDWNHQRCIDADGTGPLEPGDGGFTFTHGVTVDDNSNRVYVLDYGNNRVQVYEWQETKKNEWFHHKIPHV